MATQNLFSIQTPAIETSFVYHWHVAPNGTATASGRIDDPWSLAFASGGAGGKIKPGHHIAVHSGLYVSATATTFTMDGLQSTGVDSPDGKIIFRAYGDGLPKWQYGFSGTRDCVDINCNYLWLWGVEVYDNGWADRFPSLGGGNALLAFGATGGNGVKLIHCIIHEGQNNIGDSIGAVNIDSCEMYGNIIYNAGVDPAPQGHNFYIHHSGNAAGTAIWTLQHNINFNTWGLGLQIYATTNQINYFNLLNNITFNAGGLAFSTTKDQFHGLILGGEIQPPQHCKVLSGIWFHSTAGSRNMIIGRAVGYLGNDIEIAGNYSVGGGIGGGPGGFCNFGIQCDFSPGSTLNVHDNTFQVVDSGSHSIMNLETAGPYGFTWNNNTWWHDPTLAGWASNGTARTFANWKTATGLGNTDTATAGKPATNVVFVTPTNKYESHRGHITFFNWQNLATIAADLSSIIDSGGPYTIWDVRDLNPSGYILKGIYNGATVSLPALTQRPDPVPFGGFTSGVVPWATVPLFNCFLVRGV